MPLVMNAQSFVDGAPIKTVVPSELRLRRQLRKRAWHAEILVTLANAPNADWRRVLARAWQARQVTSCTVA